MWWDIRFKSDENQKDVVNRKNGQGSKHLKFFLLVFSKDEAQAQNPSPSPRSPSPTHEGQGQALNKCAYWMSLFVIFFCVVSRT